MQVTCPPGVSEGQSITVSAPDGSQFMAQVPKGVESGGMFQVQIPAAVGAPGQQAMGGVGDPLADKKTVLVKQEFAALECLGCEARNRYRVSVPTNDGKEGPQIFMYVTETSNCFERICCSVNRSLTLNLHSGPSKDHPIMMTMEKPFHLQHCCCCRPVFMVKDAGGSNLGTVEDPFRCCSIDQQIKDSAGQVKFRTGPTSICQLGIFCPCCADIDFPIYQNDGQRVGGVTKKALDCSEILLKTNRFVVDFDKIVDPADKRLVFAAAMLLDLEYFEQNKND